MQFLQRGKNEIFDTATIGMSKQSTEIQTAQTSIVISVERINELHQKAESLAKQAKDMAQETISVALECGRLLIEEKKQVGHGNWEQWCESNLSFSIETAQRYMRLHRKANTIAGFEAETTEGSKMAKTSHVTFLEKAKAKSLRQAYIATGILPEPPKEESQKVLQLTPHVKHIDFLVQWYRNQTETNPASKWTPFQREVLINDLAPLMEIFNELVELQEANQK